MVNFFPSHVNRLNPLTISPHHTPASDQSVYHASLAIYFIHTYPLPRPGFPSSCLQTACTAEQPTTGSLNLSLTPRERR